MNITHSHRIRNYSEGLFQDGSQFCFCYKNVKTSTEDCSILESFTNSDHSISKVTKSATIMW